jgi:quinolinate synthase
MSLASDKLETIRQQVQFHLDHAEKKQLDPARDRELVRQIKSRLISEDAVLIAH